MQDEASRLNRKTSATLVGAVLGLGLISLPLLAPSALGMDEESHYFAADDYVARFEIRGSVRCVPQCHQRIAMVSVTDTGLGDPTGRAPTMHEFEVATEIAFDRWFTYAWGRRYDPLKPQAPSSFTVVVISESCAQVAREIGLDDLAVHVIDLGQIALNCGS